MTGRLILLAAAIVATPGPSLAQFQKSYHVDVIAEDVFAIVWDDLMSFPAEGNQLVVVGRSDVVVVDANRTPTLTDYRNRDHPSAYRQGRLSCHQHPLARRPRTGQLGLPEDLSERADRRPSRNCGRYRHRVGALCG